MEIGNLKIGKASEPTATTAAMTICGRNDRWVVRLGCGGAAITAAKRGCARRRIIVGLDIGAGGEYIRGQVPSIA